MRGSLRLSLKKSLIFPLLLLSLSEMQAQFPTIPMVLQPGKVLGKAEYVVDYSYWSKMAPQSKDSVEDIIRLELGQTFVKSYSYRLWQADSALTHAPDKSARMRIPEDGMSPFWYY